MLIEKLKYCCLENISLKFWFYVLYHCLTGRSPKTKFSADYLMFSFLIFSNSSFSIISFIWTSVAVPLAEKQPYLMMLQPPCLIFGMVFFGLNILHFVARLKPCTDGQKFHFHETLCQNLTSLSRQALANTKCTLMCLGGCKGIFCGWHLWRRALRYTYSSVYLDISVQKCFRFIKMALRVIL